MLEKTKWNERRPIHLVCTAALCTLVMGAAVAVAASFGMLYLWAFAFFCLAVGVVLFAFAVGAREYEAEDGKCLVVRERTGSILDWSAKRVTCKPWPFRSGFSVEQKEGGRHA